MRTHNKTSAALKRDPATNHRGLEVAGHLIGMIAMAGFMWIDWRLLPCVLLYHFAVSLLRQAQGKS